MDENDQIPCNLVVYEGTGRKHGSTYDSLLAMAQSISENLSDFERAQILADPTADTLKKILER